jgi:hypothetical protein
MDDWLIRRFASDLVGRLHGPLTLRFVMQPATSLILATRDGIKDARADRPPYFWAIFNHPEERRALLREGWKAVARIIVLGSVLDAIYQVIVFRWIHPLELAFIVLELAFVPYLMWRGPANRIASRWIVRRKERAA